MDPIKLMGILLSFPYDLVISLLYDSFDYVPNAAIVVEHNRGIMNTMIHNMNMKTSAQEVSVTMEFIINHYKSYLMIALRHGDFFRINDPLWGESIGDYWSTIAKEQYCRTLMFHSLLYC